MGSLPGIGSGGGSCTHGGKAYEAHLNLILPAVKTGGVRRVMLPLVTACKAGASLFSHGPTKMASRPGAAPGELSFGDSAAQAGARLVEIKRAGSCVGLWPSARTSRPVPLAEPTLGEGPAFQQKTNTSWRSTRSQPAVSRRLFRCLGAHLLRSPSIVKSGIRDLALVSATNRHIPSVERDRSFWPNSVLRTATSFRCPFFSTHRFDPFGSLINSLMDK